MKTTAFQFFTFVFLVLGLYSCKKDIPDAKKKVIVDIISQNTALPGEVTIFFQVYDKKNQTPIPNLTAEDFSIYEQGPNDNGYQLISNFEAGAIIVPDNQSFVFSTMLVLDLSASVIDVNLNELIASSESFINNFMPDQPSTSRTMGIWWFDGEQNLHQLQDFTTSKNALLQAINSITSSISSDPSTNLYGAIEQSVEIAEQNAQVYSNQQILNSSAVVIFTDGTDQAAWVSENEAFDAINSTSADIKFLTIGLGDEIDKNILKDIGTFGSFFTDDPSGLDLAFTSIAQRIWDEANSYYLFKYCSPKRNGTSIKLKLEINGEANGKKHKGSAETTFDATGFTGC